jgi:hypothetical protein
MRRIRVTRLAALVAGCSLLLLPALATAQTPAPVEPTPSHASAPPVDAQKTEPFREPATAVERAKIHYDRGIQLYAEENFEAALTEFERAYELSPNFRILYSLALIQRHQNDYAAALANFQRYLREGGAGLPEDRRAEVEKEIAVLKPRCASLQIKANVDGADVFVDDAPACATGSLGTCVGKTPIAGAIVVNPGRRKIVATKPGYAMATSIVNVAGLDAININLELTSLAVADRKVDVRPRNRAIIAWSATGVVAVGAVVTGVFSLNATSKLKSDREALNANPDVLSSDAKHVKTLSLVADIFTGTAIVGGLVATYFTYQALRPETEAPAKPSAVSFDVGPTGATVFGRF